jgi:hypothetical protein
MENEVASSIVQPNTLPPNISGATCSDEVPMVRFCMTKPHESR